MVEINAGDVHDLNNQPRTSIGDTDSLSDNMALSQTDLMNTLMSALLIRGSIRCRLSTKFKCGYEIRPIVWFSKRINEVETTLGGIGLTWKKTFVKTEDITKICYSLSSFFNLSPDSNELKLVASLNGVLPQPLDYEEVLEALAQIEECSESLITLPPSHKSQRK
jgi:hypothetical protein